MSPYLQFKRTIFISSSPIGMGHRFRVVETPIGDTSLLTAIANWLCMITSDFTLTTRLTGCEFAIPTERIPSRGLFNHLVTVTRIGDMQGHSN